jgi:putative phosphoesterase
LEHGTTIFSHSEIDFGGVSLRIVVISDIHSNLDAFEAVIADLPEYDELFCLGDLVGYGPHPNEVVEKLRQLRPSVVLMGNHDYAVVTGDTEGFSSHAAEAVEWTRKKIFAQNRDYLATLRPTERLERSKRSMALFHGSPGDPLTEYIFPGIPENAARKLIEKACAEVILLGHTHMPMLYSFDREMLGNPGSVGQPRDGDPRASYAILNVAEGGFFFDIKRVDYDMVPVAEKIVQAGLPEFLGERLYIGM